MQHGSGVVLLSSSKDDAPAAVDFFPSKFTGLQNKLWVTLDLKQFVFAKADLGYYVTYKSDGVEYAEYLDEASYEEWHSKVVVGRGQLVEAKVYFRAKINIIVENKKGELTTIGSVQFDSRLGFDERFVESCNAYLRAHLPKENKAHNLYLCDTAHKLFELAEHSLRTHGCLNAVFRPCRSDSTIDLDSLEHLFCWENAKTTTEMLTIMSNTSRETAYGTTALTTAQDQLSTMAKEEIQAQVKPIRWYLEHLRRTMDTELCYYEAYRRLIINIFMICACSLLERTLAAENNMKGQPNRVGSGPFDYFSAGPARNLLLRVPEEGSLPEIETELDDVPPVPFADRWTAHADAVLEAKCVLQLSLCLGQLLAQLLDALARHERKRGVDGESGKYPESVKGILSTGQHTLFFVLQKHAVNSKPVLSYLGRRSLRVLPASTERDRATNGDYWPDSLASR